MAYASAPGRQDSDVEPSSAPASVARVRRKLLRREIQGYCAAMTNRENVTPRLKWLYRAPRYEICLNVIANHTLWTRAEGVIPTLTALQTVSSASERQIATFVGLLRDKDLVHATRSTVNRHHWILEPSPLLIAEVARHPSILALSYARLHARTAPLPSQAAFLTAAARSGVLKPRTSAFPIVSTLAEHDCGYLILIEIMHNHYESLTGTSSPSRPLTYAALAERFDVSKTHVANLIRRGRMERWFSVHRGGVLVEVDDALATEFERLMVHQLYGLGRLASSMAEAG